MPENAWINCPIYTTKAVVRRFSSKYVFLKISQISPRPAALLKRDSSTGVFLWILLNFQEHLFYRSPPVIAFDAKILNMLRYGSIIIVTNVCLLNLYIQ